MDYSVGYWFVEEHSLPLTLSFGHNDPMISCESAVDCLYTHTVEGNVVFCSRASVLAEPLRTSIFSSPLEALKQSITSVRFGPQKVKEKAVFAGSH